MNLKKKKIFNSGLKKTAREEKSSIYNITTEAARPSFQQTLVVLCAGSPKETNPRRRVSHFSFYFKTPVVPPANFGALADFYAYMTTLAKYS